MAQSSSSVTGMERTLGVIGLPIGYNFGIDMRMWSIGDKFTGVRNILPGFHYVYYSDPQDEVRQGFFLWIASDSGVIVRKWDSSIESLTAVSNRDEESNMKATFVNDFRYISGLAPYDKCTDEESSRDWRSASRFITPEVLARIQPLNALAFKSRPQSSIEIDTSDVPTIFWTDIGKVKLPLGTPSDLVTRHNVDRTLHLEQVIEASGYTNAVNLVGELQASFILFLLGLNYDAFVQWRRLLELFLGCREAGIRAHALQFTVFCESLLFQIKQLPEDYLFDGGMTDDNIPHSRNSKSVFILPLLAEFILTCSDESLLTEPELTRAVDNLDRVMNEKYGNEWTGLFAPDEDLPVIVDH